MRYHLLLYSLNKLVLGRPKAGRDLRLRLQPKQMFATNTPKIASKSDWAKFKARCPQIYCNLYLLAIYLKLGQDLRLVVDCGKI